MSIFEDLVSDIHVRAEVKHFTKALFKYIPVPDLYFPAYAQSQAEELNIAVHENAPVCKGEYPLAEFKKTLAIKLKVPGLSNEAVYSWTGKTVVMTLPRYLRRYANIDLPDHELRDLSYKIWYEMHPPVDYFVAETAEQYFDMHNDVGLSCMSVYNQQFSEYNNAFSDALREQGRWPSEFYVYCPQITGIYAKPKNGKTLARALILTRDDGTKTVNSVYGQSKYTAILKEFASKEFGATISGGRISQRFAIPQSELLGNIVCPIPRCDLVENDVTYVKSNKEFIIKPIKSGDQLINKYKYCGWMTDKYTAAQVKGK